MPNVQDGLTEGFPDVNSDDGFVEALAAKVERDVPADYLAELRDSDTSVARGLTDGPAKQSAPAPVAAEAPSEEVPSGAASEEETPATDDAVAQYVAANGGTPEQALAKLLQEHENLQTLDGRRSNELGDLRKRLSDLEGFLQEAATEETTPPPLPSAGGNEELENFFEENGPRGAMDWIVNNRPDLIEEAIQVWSGYDEVAATRFATRYDRFLDEQTKAAGAQASPAEDPFLAQMKQQAAFTQNVERARVESNFSDEEWASVKDFVIPVIEDEKTPAIIRRAISAPRDADEQVEGFKAVFQYAQSRALADATAKATSAARNVEQETAVEAKRRATVATGSLTPPQTGQSGNEEEDAAERIQRFKKSILEAETTDIASGLTFGGKPAGS